MTDSATRHSIGLDTAGRASPFDPLASPVFILGLHRSGTTVLYEMLSRSGCWNNVSAWHVISIDEILKSPLDAERSRSALADRFAAAGISSRQADEVVISPETHEEYGFILNNHGYRFHITRRSFPFFRDVCHAIQSTHPEPRPLLLKNPWDFGNAPLIKRLIPSARFVYIHRDPMETLTSMWRFVQISVGDTNAYQAMICARYGRFLQRRFHLALSRWFLRRRPRSIVRAMVRQSSWRCRAYLKSVERIPEADRVEITYDALCGDPNGTIRGILDRFRLTGAEVDYSTMIRRRPFRCDELVAGEADYVKRRFAPYLDRCRRLPTAMP